MSLNEIVSEISALSADEKHALLFVAARQLDDETDWSAAETPEFVAELNRRWAEYLEDPSKVTTIEESIARMRSKKAARA